ncbi:FtsX-like permease family protein [candidate division KSB1 bacterium]|nr:FtsX-like permease family protein [candidate division KSB1 bacterium]
MIIFKIAFRNIFRQKRRSILTALTMFGGFTLAAISIGWSDGTYSTIINLFTRNQLGHIQIHKQDYREQPSIYKTIDDYKQVEEKLSGIEGVETWTPRLFSAGIVSVRENSNGARIIGIDPEQENIATRFNKKLIKGDPFSKKPSHETILGKGLAKVLEAGIGDSAVVVSQAADGSIANDLYTIIGIIESGDQMTDRMSFYLHIDDAQELFVLQGRIHEIAVIARELDQVDALTGKIADRLDNPQLEVASWKEFAKSFYHAMQADVQGMWIMLFVIILIVAVGVLNTVLMSVLERRKEYGVLRAIGTKPRQIITLVLWEVSILALISVVIGIGLSSIINSSLSDQGFPLPESFTYGGVEFAKMYSEVSARSLYIPTITVIITALLVSFFPALKAAHSEPAKEMRTH